MKTILVFFLLAAFLAAKDQIVIKGVFEYQHVGCCDPVVSHIQFEHPMKDVPQVLLTIRAIEYETGPIAFFTSLNQVTQKGFVAEVTIPKGILKLLIYEYVALNQEEVELGFFNIDALGTLRLQQAGDSTVPLFMRFKRHFVEEPLVQVFIVGFETETKEIQFEVSPFSVAQNGVTLKISKFGSSGLSRLQVSYVATEQSQDLAKLVTHTGVKTAAVSYEFVEMKEDDTPTSEESEESLPPEPQEPKLELMQLVGVNGIRFQTTPISFIWQGDKMEPTALNVNLRITLDKGNQVILGLYYFELKAFRKCPVIFAECGYQGSHVYICKNIPDFERVFKQAKSVKLPPHTSLVVYQDTSYLGAKTRISLSQECLNDWFNDVPQEETKESQILLQLNKYKKHKGEFSDISLLQRSSKKNGEDYWQIQKKSFGVKMPEWYEYKQDGSIQKINEDNDSGKKFEKIEVDDDKSNISFENILNHNKEDDSSQIMDDDGDQYSYNQRLSKTQHLNDDEQVL